MRFIVPSFMRVGSTWVCEAIGRLLEFEGQRFYEYLSVDRKIGDVIDAGDLELIDGLTQDCVTKTHSYSPRELINLLPEDAYLVAVHRNFFDTFVSRFMYERYARPKQGLQTDKMFKNLLDKYPNIPDSAGMNLLIECRQTEMKRFIRLWCESNYSVVHPRVITIDYDKLCGNNDALINKLNAVIKAPGHVVTKVTKDIEFDAMQNRLGKEFVRFGVVGNWKHFIDSSSKEVLDGEIQKVNREFLASIS